MPAGGTCFFRGAISSTKLGLGHYVRSFGNKYIIALVFFLILKQFNKLLRFSPLARPGRWPPCLAAPLNPVSRCRPAAVVLLPSFVRAGEPCVLLLSLLLSERWTTGIPGIDAKNKLKLFGVYAGIRLPFLSKQSTRHCSKCRHFGFCSS